MISTHNNVVTALEGEQLRFAWLVKLPGAAPETPLYLTDYGVDIDFDGVTWKSGGYLLSLPTLKREKEVRAHGVDIELAASDGVLNGAFAVRNLTGESCVFSLVFLDENNQIIGDPAGGTALVMYSGTFDGWSYSDSSAGDTISVRITSPWVKPRQTAGRLTSDYDQKERYAGDAFFQYAHEKKDNLGWGGEG